MLLAMAVLFSSFLLGGTGSALAHENYRDQHGNYHHYGYRHHHRGYWDQRDGARLWINIG